MAWKETPPSLRIPWWLGLSISAASLGGFVYGWRSRRETLLGAGRDAPLPQRVAQGVFVGAGLGYLGISLLDFWEHFRLEKEATGRYWSFEVVPPGETANHLATLSTLGGLFVLARPLPPGRLRAGDWFTLLAPALLLALGWRDEIVYHRRRARHREDMMHTTAHLAMGAMLAGYCSTRSVPWPGRRPRVEEWLRRRAKEPEREQPLEGYAAGSTPPVEEI